MAGDPDGLTTAHGRAATTPALCRRPRVVRQAGLPVDDDGRHRRGGRRHEAVALPTLLLEARPLSGAGRLHRGRPPLGHRACRHGGRRPPPTGRARLCRYFRLVVTNEGEFRLLYGRDLTDDEELGRALRAVEDAIAEAIDPLIDAGLKPTIVGCWPTASSAWPRGEPALHGTTAARSTTRVRRALDEEAQKLAQRMADLAGPACARSTRAEPAEVRSRRHTSVLRRLQTPTARRRSGVHVGTFPRRIEDVLVIGHLDLGQATQPRVRRMRAGAGRGRGKPAEGAGLGRGVGELPPDEAHMVGLHDHDEVGVHEVDPVDLAAAMTPEVTVSQLGQPDSAVRVRIPMGCPSTECVPAVTMCRGSPPRSWCRCANMKPAITGEPRSPCRGRASSSWSGVEQPARRHRARAARAGSCW